MLILKKCQKFHFGEGIVEVVYNFINFYALVLEDFREKPEEISFRV